MILLGGRNPDRAFVSNENSLKETEMCVRDTCVRVACVFVCVRGGEGMCACECGL